MTRYATILLLAAAATAQFAGDAGAPRREIATRPTNWLAQAHKKSAGAPKRKRWKRVKHIPATDPRSPFYVDPNAPKTAMASTARVPPPGAECRQYSSTKGVTIVTSATWGRVRQNLEPLCRRWRGPISVAMMLRVAVGRPDANEETQAKHIDQAHHMALSAGCTDVSIEAKTSPAESMFTRQFPVNLLRNLAWSKARTEYVLLLDIDFWPGLETRQALLDAINADNGEDRRAFIVPSFTLLKRLTRVDNPNPALYYKADSLVNRIPSTLDELTRCLAREITTPPRDVYCASFHFHGSTRVAHWLRDSHDPATNASLWDLPCTLHKYEPFVAVPRCGKPTMSPRFNVRFTGYGKNKISWFASLRAASFRFAPVKRAFATHMPHNLSKAHRQWAGIDVTGRAPLQDRVNKIYAQLMEDLGLFNAEAAEENLERLHYLREDEVATPDCGVSQKTSVDLEDFRNNDLREVAKACRSGDCDAARVLRVLDQRWTAVDAALERPFAERVRESSGPAKYPSKFGSTVARDSPAIASQAIVAPHVLMRGGVESFDHFMRLEVGDMTPRDTGANKWAYDPRYNRALRRPDGVYNSKPRPQRVAPASRVVAAKKAAASANKTAAAPPKAASAPAAPAKPTAASPVAATAAPAVPATPPAPAAPAPVVTSEAPAAPAVPASPVEAVAPAASAPVAVSKTPPASPEKAAAPPVAASKVAAPSTPAAPATQTAAAPAAPAASPVEATAVPAVPATAARPVVSKTPVAPAAPAVASDAPAAPAVVASPVKAAAVPAASAPAAKPKAAAPEPVASTTQAAPATPAAAVVSAAPLAPAVAAASASVAPATPPAAPSAPPMESVGRGED